MVQKQNTGMKKDKGEILHEILRRNAFIVINLNVRKMHLYSSSLTVVFCDTFPTQVLLDNAWVMYRGVLTEVEVNYKKEVWREQSVR